MYVMQQTLDCKQLGNSIILVEIDLTGKQAEAEQSAGVEKMIEGSTNRQLDWIEIGILCKSLQHWL